MGKTRSLKQFSLWKELFGRAFKKLGRNNPLLLAGATAFFTLFSIAPILLFMIKLAGILFNDSEIKRTVAKKLAEVMGSKTQSQIAHTLSALSSQAREPLVTILGFLVLLFLSTNIFNVVKISLNTIWMVKPVQHLGLGQKLKMRLRFVLLIIAAGFFLVIGFVGETLKNLLGKELDGSIPYVSFYFRGVFHYLFSLVIDTAWFAIIFRYLADVRPSWKTVFAGALFTAVLFILGRILLHSLLLHSNITTLYGASASIVLLLLFVFYASLLLYYGASFTVVWAEEFQQPVEPLPYAHFFEIEEKGSKPSGS